MGIGPTLAKALAAVAGGPALVSDTSSQDAHKDGHPQEAEPAQHSGQHRLWQEAWQLGARRVDLQACTRGHEGGPVSRLSGLIAPRPPSWPSRQVLTRSGDVGYIAGITDMATSQGHKAELIENILGVGGPGSRSGSGLTAYSNPIQKDTAVGKYG